jgi:hypothetical protein
MPQLDVIVVADLGRAKRRSLDLDRCGQDLEVPVSTGPQPFLTERVDTSGRARFSPPRQRREE